MTKRRILFIQPSFQLRLIVWVIGIVGVASLCSAGILYALVHSELQSQASSVQIGILESQRRLGWSIVVGNLAAFVLAIVPAVLAGLYISHKIAGPLYRFRGVFDQIAGGNLEVSAELRRDDQLQELSFAVVHMVDRLRARQKRQEATVQQISGMLEAATEEGLTSAERQRLLADAQRRLDSLRASADEA